MEPTSWNTLLLDIHSSVSTQFSVPTQNLYLKPSFLASLKPHPSQRLRIDGSLTDIP